MSTAVDPTLRNLNDCGCCQGLAVYTPARVYNRPGLSAVAYRVGNHAQFKGSMLARLSGIKQAALKELKTRDDDDFSIALLDAWATVAEVLTFYQERLANESYLRTASERLSILYLARLIGYQLQPGVAASTYLAFTLEETAEMPGQPLSGVPARATIELGTRVQSIPKDGKQPQVFETIEEIEARAAWNALKAKASEPQLPEPGDTTLYLKGTATNLEPGDALLLVGPNREKDVQGEDWDFCRVKAVTPIQVAEPDAGHTQVTLERPLGPQMLQNPKTYELAQPPKVYALRQRANLFGYNAPDWRTMPESVTGRYLARRGLYAEYFDNINLTNRKVTRIDPQVNFEWEKGSPDPEIGPDNFSARWTGWIQIQSTGWHTFYTFSDDGVRLWVDGQRIIDQWNDHSGTRHSGKIWLVAGQKYSIRLEYYEHLVVATIKLEWLPPGQSNRVVIPQSQLFPPNTPNEWPDFAVTSIVRRRGLFAEYFDNFDLTNRKVTRIDSRVNFDWGTGSPDDAIESNTFSARWTGLVEPKVDGEYTFYTYSDDGVRLWVGGQPVIDNWTLHSATTDSGTISLNSGRKYDIRLEYFQGGGEATIKLSWSEPGQQSPEIIPQSQLFPPDIHLDGTYSKIVTSSWAVLSIPDTNFHELYQVRAAAEDSRSKFTLNAKTTRLTLDGADLNRFDHKLRETVVLAQSDELKLAEQPIPEPVSKNYVRLRQPVQGLYAGRLLAVSGVVDDVSGEAKSEVVMLKEADDNGTKLVFTTDLQHSYRRDSVLLNANVARATHGESKEEVLGSGDGSQSYQRFVLSHSPLTHVSAPTPSGSESTLKVRVNDVRWDEADSLTELGPNGRRYITRLDDEGNTTVVFGDGQHGARLPTGMENVKAVYRAGIGRAGNVDANQITLLAKRPPGVRSVTNPLPATGGGDPESRDQARRNAPLTVLTIDRIVSLQDYEDFARAFAGISKALATLIWIGRERGVFVTVAGPGGAEVPDGSATHQYLLWAMRKAGDPFIPLQVKSYREKTFQLEAKVQVHGDHMPDKVLAEVEQNLHQHFSFEARAFGQPVTRSEVTAVIQDVAGVIAVDIDFLYRTGERKDLNAYLPATVPQPGSKTDIKAAELLILHPEPVELRVTS
jgi:hypothetical protein